MPERRRRSQVFSLLLWITYGFSLMDDCLLPVIKKKYEKGQVSIGLDFFPSKS